MIKVLISHVGIPCRSIGSWRIMITNLVNNDNLLFDYIISPKPDYYIDDVKFFSVSKYGLLSPLLEKFINHYKYKDYWNQLRKIINKKNTEKIAVNIIDNKGILLAIDYFAKKKGLRDHFHINYFLHGYNFGSGAQVGKTYNAIDTLVLLTNNSYKNQILSNHAIPCEIKLLRNGIDSKVFYPINDQDKKVLRNQLGFSTEKTYFLWISQDRPKKGLTIVLKAWRKIIKKHSNLELIIIGTHQEIKEEQVVWFERMENTRLASYYQATDYYLFSTLCHEGHPLSLTEALKCGAKCLASNIDPVSEVLHEGNLGLLVDKPNYVTSWEKAIHNVLENDINFNKENIDLLKLYDIEKWANEMKTIVNE